MLQFTTSLLSIAILISQCSNSYADVVYFGSAMPKLSSFIESSDEASRGRALQFAEANVCNHEKSSDAWGTLGWIQWRTGDEKSARRSLQIAASTGNVSRDTAYFISRAFADDKPKQLLESIATVLAETNGPSLYPTNSSTQTPNH